MMRGVGYDNMQEFVMPGALIVPSPLRDKLTGVLPKYEIRISKYETNSKY